MNNRVLFLFKMLIVVFRVPFQVDMLGCLWRQQDITCMLRRTLPEGLSSTVGLVFFPYSFGASEPDIQRRHFSGYKPEA